MTLSAYSPSLKINKSPSMTAKHKFLCKRISKLVTAAKLRLIMGIITDNMYIENSEILTKNDHEIRTHHRIVHPLFHRL